MLPRLLPPPGTVIGNQQQMAGLVGRIARQAELNATMNVDGMNADVGDGIRVSAPFASQLQCFEITSCWEATNRPTLAGASRGLFWVCSAKQVGYWWQGGSGSSESQSDSTDTLQCTCEPEECVHRESSSESEESYSPSMNTYWGTADEDREERIFWAVSAPESARGWQRTLYPLLGIGQWVWCVYDYEADVWRVLDGYDDIIRFQLVEPLYGCGSARARVIGYPCRTTCAHSSSSSESGSSVASSSVPSTSESHSIASESESGGPPPSTGGCPGGFPVSEASAEVPEDLSVAPQSSQSLALVDTGCLLDAINRGRVDVWDMLGISNTTFSNSTAPPCTTGWAKYCADKERFEVLAYGTCLGRQPGTSEPEVSTAESFSVSAASMGSASASGSGEASSQSISESESESFSASMSMSFSFSASSHSQSESHASTPSEGESASQSSASKSFSQVSSQSGASTPSEIPPSNPPHSSEAPPSSEPSGGQSSKSTAIVPASWSEAGYTALFVEESPEVRFNDLMRVTVIGEDNYFSIDPKFIEVCEPDSLVVCGCVPEAPAIMGATVVGDQVRVRTVRACDEQEIRVVLHLSGIRKGFAGLRFPDRTEEQFESNERFIRSAYPGV